MNGFLVCLFVATTRKSPHCMPPITNYRNNVWFWDISNKSYLLMCCSYLCLKYSKVIVTKLDNPSEESVVRLMSETHLRLSGGLKPEDNINKCLVDQWLFSSEYSVDTYLTLTWIKRLPNRRPRWVVWTSLWHLNEIDLNFPLLDCSSGSW